jgi:hypothetical protein
LPLPSPPHRMALTRWRCAGDRWWPASSSTSACSSDARTAPRSACAISHKSSTTATARYHFRRSHTLCATQRNATQRNATQRNATQRNAGLTGVYVTGAVRGDVLPRMAAGPADPRRGLGPLAAAAQPQARSSLVIFALLVVFVVTCRSRSRPVVTPAGGRAPTAHARVARRARRQHIRYARPAIRLATHTHTRATCLFLFLLCFLLLFLLVPVSLPTTVGLHLLWPVILYTLPPTQPHQPTSCFTA